MNRKSGFNLKVNGRRARSYADWRASIPSKPVRRHRRDGSGQLKPVRNTASRTNARTKKLRVLHGRYSALLSRGEFDRRTVLGKAFACRLNQVVREHEGRLDDKSVPVLRRVVLAQMQAEIAFADLMNRGLFKADGSPRPSLAAYFAAERRAERIARASGLLDAGDAGKYLRTRNRSTSQSSRPPSRKKSRW